MSAGGIEQPKQSSSHPSGVEALFEASADTPLSPPSPAERTLALMAHVGGIFTFWLAPLVLLLMHRENRFVEDQAKEALNFQITMFLATILAGLSTLLLIGFVLLPLVWIYQVVGCILAGVAVNKGKMFRYRWCLRLIK